MTKEERLSAIKTTEAEIKKKKERFRDPEHQPPSLWRYYDLDTLKHRATVLYAATATMRGKIHFKNGTPETQQEFVDKHLPVVLEWMKDQPAQPPTEPEHDQAGLV